MGAGKYRHRVALQANTPTRDNYGGAIDQWATTAHVFVQIEPVSARNIELARGYAVTANHKITARYSAALTAQKRLVHPDGRTFYIEGVANPDGRMRESVLFCTEKQV